MTTAFKNFQRTLQANGHDPKGIDGAGGKNTAAAFAALLAEQGFVVDVKSTATTLTITPVVRVTKADQNDLPWMMEAQRVLGLHEIRNKEELAKWLKSDGATLGDPSKLPWCGDYIDTSLRLALPAEPRTGALKENPYWAKNWALLGVPCDPMYGAVLSFTREGGGHVAFCVGQDAAHYYVLGGNQSNSVNVTRIAKDRLYGSRWPKTWPIPAKVYLPTMKPGDTIVSQNEA